MICFGPYESAILQVGQELSYTSSVLDGDGKARPFKINASRLVEARGLRSRTQVYNVIHALLACNVLLGSLERLTINKNYKSWSGDYQLNPKQVEECDSADTRPVTSCGSYLTGNARGNTDPIKDLLSSPQDNSTMHLSSPQDKTAEGLSSPQDILSSPQDNACNSPRARRGELIPEGEWSTTPPIGVVAIALGSPLFSQAMALTNNHAIASEIDKESKHWASHGIIDADVIDAMLVASAKKIPPQRWVSFVLGASKRVAERRLAVVVAPTPMSAERLAELTNFLLED